MTGKSVTIRRDFPPFARIPANASEALSRWLTEVRVTAGKTREWRGASAWAVGPRQMESALWLWLGRGRGCARVAGQEYSLAPGDVLLARGDVAHTVWLKPAPDLHFITVHFQAQVEGGIDLLQLVEFPPHLPAESGAPYGPAARRLAREFALQAPGWQRAMAAELFGLLVHVVRRHGDRIRLPEEPGFTRALHRLLPALQLLEGDLGRSGLTVSELARQARVSEVYVRRLFHRVVGRGPTAFLQRQRIQRACDLLRGSDLPIKEVAAACGFTQVPFFYRVFHRWTGVTPARYRAGAGLE
jgi:AraC-like DNA-binding protein